MAQDYQDKINEAISLAELNELKEAVESDDDLESKDLEYLLDLIDEKKADFE